MLLGLFLQQSGSSNLSREYRFPHSVFGTTFLALSKSEFDAAALELRKRQQVFLSLDHDPHNLPQQERDFLSMAEMELTMSQSPSADRIDKKLLPNPFGRIVGYPLEDDAVDVAEINQKAFQRVSAGSRCSEHGCERRFDLVW